MRTTKHSIRWLCWLTALVLVLGLGFSCMPIQAHAVNASVQAVSNGTLQFNMVYRDDYGNDLVIATGTCFLINENTVVTCAHCCTLTEDDLAIVAEIVGKSVNETHNRLGFTVNTYRDITVKASIMKQSAEMDYAILTLETSLRDRTPLSLRSREHPIEQTDEVYAIGFPAQSRWVQDINTFSADDVTITNGRVAKIGTGDPFVTGTNYDYIQTTCKLTSGISGGPMVDENGYVVGVCQGYTGENSSSDYYYAISIQQVMATCDTLGISYNIDPDPVPPPPPTSVDTVTPSESSTPTINDTELNRLIELANGKKADDFTEDSYKALQNALTEAKSAVVSNDQTRIDSAVTRLNSAIKNLEEKSGGNKMLLIIIIAAAALLIIILVVVILAVSSKKKKKTPVPAATQARPMAQQPMRPNVPTAGPAPTGPSVGGFAPSAMNVAPPARPGTLPLTPEVGATTVLSGAGETTVLSKKVNGGVLIRRKNGEKIEINNPEFTVGRERRRVVYCIEGNTAIGRQHAKFVVRDGVTYLVDLNATNGTFLNGVKCTPNAEMPLKNGDTVTLADDDFEYRI